MVGFFGLQLIVADTESCIGVLFVGMSVCIFCGWVVHLDKDGGGMLESCRALRLHLVLGDAHSLGNNVCSPEIPLF